MTAPYRIRDALGDDQAEIYLVGMLSVASLVGLTPAVTELWSLGTLLMLVYVAAATAVLLGMMYVTDRRLREVSG